MEYFELGFKYSSSSKGGPSFNNKDIIGDNGKVIKRPVNDTVVEYNIIVVKDDDIDFKTFKSVVPGENNILENYDGGFKI